MKRVVLSLVCAGLCACGDSRDADSNQGGVPTAQSGNGQLSGVAPGVKPDYSQTNPTATTNSPGQAPGGYTSASGASGTPLSGAEAGLSKPEPISNQQKNEEK